MKPLTAQQLIAVLTAHGFVISRQRGSHMIWRQPTTGVVVPVPLHGGNKPLPRGTYFAIVKQSKIPRYHFVKS